MDKFAWGPDRRISYLVAAACLAAVAWRLLDADPENRLVAVVLAVACAVVALLLVRIRVRLRADHAGIVVIGPLHARRITWAEIETITTPRRGRFGRHAAWLELEIRPDPDATTPAARGPDDDAPELLAFGAFDLGADPATVGRTLLRLRAEA